ncbi:MAG: type I DNA topoisomerase [Saccharofermentanales bacterium]
MKRDLVIVESPAKAKTIGRYLGEKYRIAASVGHIRDLPTAILGVDIKKDFTPMYIPMKGKEKVIKELISLAQDSGKVYIATDPDREGEAIAWHIAKILKIDPASDSRISFNEITEAALKNAITHPRQIDMNLVNAQQARRILDRLVGYEISPLLWKKIKKGLSAGRVQSVATRLIVDKEEDINKFIPEEFWDMTATLKKIKKDSDFKAKYYGFINNDKISKRKLNNEEDKNEVLGLIKDKDFVVHTIKKGNKHKQPFAPFTTSTLQQDASRSLGFTSKKTMSIAQQLYEGIELENLGQTALVTYIRTDSVRSSDDAVEEIRNMISTDYGDKYLAKTIRKYKNKNKTQDAHEAIRPAHFDISPDSVRHTLSNDQYRLYKLIWNRFMASQMADASIDTVTVDIKVAEQIFRATGETVVFPGFMTLYGEQAAKPEVKDDESQDDIEQPVAKEKIPELIEGEPLECINLNSEQKFTKPPARYTEATLIKALEEMGIGRPSTYAPTISTVLDRKYIEKEKNYLVPTQLGILVTDLLKGSFKNIVDVHFTAEMENLLDTVEEGKTHWVDILKDFYPPFHEQIEKASKTLEKVIIEDVLTGESCPECGSPLVLKEGRYGKFSACKNYPTCKYTKNVEQEVKGKCPLCGSGLLIRSSKKFKGSKFYTCDKRGSDPECKFISWDLPLEGKTCETCGTYMVLKRFKGRAYPKCGNRDCATNKRTAKNEEKAD